MRRIAPLGITLLALLRSADASADGCEKFAWSLAREQAWVAAPDKAIIAAGQTLAALPKAAVVIHLQPASQAVFELPPERKPRSDQWFGGTVRFPAVERPGIYQVTFSDDAWIDIIQDGRYARSVGSTGRSDCPGLRKSVRLELGPAPFALQISGVASDGIVIAIGPVE
jgi:hypothetical protein